LTSPSCTSQSDILLPDLAGWRRERMPVAVADEPYFTLVPDWVAKVLSPSTSKYDRTDKLRIYAREHVEWMWLIDPILRTLEVLRRAEVGWSLAAPGATTSARERSPSMQSSSSSACHGQTWSCQKSLGTCPELRSRRRATPCRRGSLLAAHLRDRPCRVQSSDGRIRVASTGLITYPEANARRILAPLVHRPLVSIARSWYYA